MDTDPAAPTPPPFPVDRLYLRLPRDVGLALRVRATREERPTKTEAIRLLRAALVAAGELPPALPGS